MRIILLAVVVTFGTVIGVNAIDNVSEMQDAKMTRFCKSVPVGASYDEMCKEFRWKQQLQLIRFKLQNPKDLHRF